MTSSSLTHRLLAICCVFRTSKMVREWLKAFFTLLLKYRGVVSLAKSAEKALAMSKNVRKIQETLTDKEKQNSSA